MNDEMKWIGWDKPETVTSNFALEMRVPLDYARLWHPGAFKFNDGTTQGWKIDQLYDTNDAGMTKISAFTDPTTNQFYGFTMTNQQNLALAVGAFPLIVAGSTAKSLDFYLESPKLKSNPDWKNPKGFSFDLQRNFLSLCTDPPLYYVQLQVRMWDKKQKKMRTFAEWDTTGQSFVFHQVQAGKPYRFIWTADDPFADADLKVRFLRIRFTQPNLTAPGAGECLPKGAWLVGNISPE